MPQLLADVLERDILVVDESHLPAIGAAAMCVEVLDGRVVIPPQARRVQPRHQNSRDLRSSLNAGGSTEKIWSTVADAPR